MVVVHAASVQDRDGARTLLAPLRSMLHRLRLIWADGGYAGELVDWVWDLRPRRKVRLAIVNKPEGQRGFAVLPKRWIVERTFAWLGKWRRLSKDYEGSPASSECCLRIAMIGLMVRRLANLKTAAF